LALAGADSKTIIDDYAETDEHLAAHRELLLANSGAPASLGSLTDELLSSRSANMEMILDYIGANYGAARKYLQSAGISDAALDKIMAMMTEADK
jgi:hypothetical protein